LKVGTKGRDVCSRVTDRDVAVVLAVTVGLHVASSSLDIGCGNRSVTSGENFVADKETSGVVELLEFIHDLCKCIVLRLVPLRRSLLNLSSESVEVDEKVNSSVGESLHTVLVIGSGVHVVNTDSVSTQSLHQRCIQLALVVVDERILGNKLVSDTSDKVLVAIAGEELATLDRDCGNSRGNGGECESACNAERRTHFEEECSVVENFRAKLTGEEDYRVDTRDKHEIRAALSRPDENNNECKPGQSSAKKENQQK